AELVHAVDVEHSIYCLQALGIYADGELPVSIDDLAADYEAIIRDIDSAGPYSLLGYSFGGLVAHTIACRLQESGFQVDALVILDYYPALRDLSPDEHDVEQAEFARWFAAIASTTQQGLDAPAAARAAAMMRHCLTVLRPAFQPRAFHGDVLVFATSQNVS